MSPVDRTAAGRARLLYDDELGGVWAHDPAGHRWWLAYPDGWHSAQQPDEQEDLLLLGTTEIPGEDRAELGPVSATYRAAFRHALVAAWGRPAPTGLPGADELLDGLFDRVDTAERERDQADDLAHRNADIGEEFAADAHRNADLAETFGALAEQYKARAVAAEKELERHRRSLQDVRHHLDRAHRLDVAGWQRLALELSDAITAVIGTGAAETETDRG